MEELQGYDSGFLKVPLKLPKIDFDVCVPRKDGQSFEIKYTHFSTFQHKIRRLPLMTDCNIRGAEFNAETREGGEPWHYSKQIENNYQLNNDFYGNDDRTFDRGHVVHRVDPAWGPNGLQADYETFHYANVVPQHSKLNRKNGIWYELEQHIMEKGVKNKASDISVRPPV